MRRYGASGNKFYLTTGVILRNGGTNIGSIVFELPASNSNAGYILNFNVLCNTRS